MLYYGIISLCALMFSSQFFFTGMYREAYGDDIKAMLVSSAGGAVVGIIILSLINGFSFGYTHFSLFMAMLVGLNNLGVIYSSLKILGRVNLSVYSTFMMLGGMVLPFAVGVLFFNEALTAGKIICCIFIAGALFLTMDKTKKSSGLIYYAGIFVLNGMSGVLTKIYQAAPFEKVTAAEYSILCAATALVMSLIWLMLVKGEKRRLNLKAVTAICAKGILSRVANLLLLVSLTYLPASVQYPFITGGTMIFSTLISYFTPQKPKKREVASVIVAFVGLVIMFLFSE